MVRQGFGVEKVPDDGEVPVRFALAAPAGVAGEGDSLAHVSHEMSRLAIDAVPVTATDGTLKGLLVRADLDDALRKGSSDSLTAGDVCRPGVAVGIDAPIQIALDVLEAEQVGHIPVVEGNKLAGQIGPQDIEAFREKRRRFHEQHRVAELTPHERAQVMWRMAQPTAVSLTWGIDITGEAFIAKAESYGVFGPDQAILEIGPGYGRLLAECLRRELPFRKYVGVDIAPANAKHLAEQFDRDDFEVVNADIETVSLDDRFDVVFSSLTLKHLYPSLETALRNVERHLNPGATVIFDVPEGEFSSFYPGDDVTWVRGYSRAEMEAILPGIPLELVAFDEVVHAPGYGRLLVVARKP